MPFGNLVSIGTASPAAVNSSVVAVFDLGNPNTRPFNTNSGSIYSDPSWSETVLGCVFGVTLDNDGNIYVASTSCYDFDTTGTLGGSGAVYKIDTFTSAASLFCTLPNTGPELGNLCYDCTHDQFFVSNMDDGQIYRVTRGGSIASTFDFGAPDVSLAFGEFAPLGERIWAVQVHGGRLYFSVWNEDSGNRSPLAANEIWSIALSPSGDFMGAPQLEISLPVINGEYSNPVSDMRFTATGSLFLAERGMSNATTPRPHDARLLEYICVAGVWTPSSNAFAVGIFNTLQNSSGGVDVNDGLCGRVYVTGDALQLAPQVIYGTQGIPLTGGGTATSVLIDYNGNLSAQDKTDIGDVAIPCVASDPCPGTTYCVPNPNSTGGPARIIGVGSAVIANNLLTLIAEGMPNNSFGYFLTSLTQANTPNPGGSQGVLCLGGAIGRYTGPGQVKNTGATGAFSLLLDLTQIPTPTGFVPAVVGQSRNFQAWHRDSVGGVATSNLTNGLAVTFL